MKISLFCAGVLIFSLVLVSLLDKDNNGQNPLDVSQLIGRNLEFTQRKLGEPLKTETKLIYSNGEGSENETVYFIWFKNDVYDEYGLDGEMLKLIVKGDTLYQKLETTQPKQR